MNLLAAFENWPKPYALIVGGVLIGLIGILDSLTGYELAFSVFYVLPISLVTWLTGQRSGVGASLASAIVWLGADFAAGHHYSHPLIPFWNTLIRLAFFTIITLLLSALKRAIDHERELSHTDFLTGAASSRLFYQLLELEIGRAQRYNRPFTLAYLDFDNFKAANDNFGHSAGDLILCAVVSHAKKHLRKIDIIGRLGGDEFGLLLPETGEEAARIAIAKLLGGLLEEMQRNNWPITFSVGALTCHVPPTSADELVKMADKLMYSVKQGSKNAIKYSTYPA